MVNGVVVAPTVGLADAFCSAGGDTTFWFNFTHPSITVVIQGKEGTNTVKIRARGNDGVEEFTVGDSALVIYDLRSSRIFNDRALSAPSTQALTAMMEREGRIITCLGADSAGR